MAVSLVLRWIVARRAMARFEARKCNPLPKRGARRLPTMRDPQGISVRRRYNPGGRLHDSTRPRSPVLGYNHNLRHGGRVFHVQTEDSGQGYARLHTHLFYEGTILSSKKQEYDPSAPEDAVRALMQQLHKAMIRELTHGEHDARIGAFFIARGEPPRLDAGAPRRPPRRRSPPAKPRSALAQRRAPRRRAPQRRPRPRRAAAARAKAGGDGQAGRRAAAAGRASSSAGRRRGPAQRRHQRRRRRASGQRHARRRAPGAGDRQRARDTAPRPQAPVAASDGAVVPAKGRARAAAPPESAPQPLASSRDIRMPWETPGPRRAPRQQPIITRPRRSPDGRARST